MILFPCPYLGSDVEFTDERVDHVTSRHPDLLPAHMDLVGKTLLDPDLVRISRRMATVRELSRWYADLLSGANVVVVVATSTNPKQRPSIITAYIASRLAKGQVEWNRN